MKISHSALNMITISEGLKTKAYKDSAGIPTIGIGTITYPNGTKVKMGDTCTEESAFAWLESNVQNKVTEVGKALAGVKLTQNQIDAIASLTYNIGTSGFLNSTACRLIKANPIDPKIKDAWLSWNKATIDGKKQEVKGLTLRRKREYQLYTS
jgi:lysozyme